MYPSLVRHVGASFEGPSIFSKQLYLSSRNVLVGDLTTVVMTIPWLLDDGKIVF